MRADTLDRAQEAAFILQSAVFVEVFERTEREILAQWQAEKDPAKREELHQRQASLTWVRSCLVGHINAAANEEFRDNEGKPGYWRALWNKLRSGAV
jgi:hypothetical protein